MSRFLIQISLIAIVFLQLNEKLKNKHLLGHLTVRQEERGMGGVPASIGSQAVFPKVPY